MIAFLRGTVLQKADHSLILDVQGVGYEVFCSTATIEQIAQVGGYCQLYIFTQFRSESIALFGFQSQAEKDLFLSLIKVDSVGPKSALNILSAAPCYELTELIESGDVAALSKLPKISKKTAEQVVVKLKGKLSELLLSEMSSLANAGNTKDGQSNQHGQSSQNIHKRKLRSEIKLSAQSALTHLGYKPSDVERVLENLNDDVWSSDLQNIIRQALTDISGRI